MSLVINSIILDGYVNVNVSIALPCLPPSRFILWSLLLKVSYNPHGIQASMYLQSTYITYEYVKQANQNVYKKHSIKDVDPFWLHIMHIYTLGCPTILFKCSGLIVEVEVLSWIMNIRNSFGWICNVGSNVASLILDIKNSAPKLQETPRFLMK